MVGMKNYIHQDHMECHPLNDLARGFYNSVRSTAHFAVPDFEGPYAMTISKTEDAVRLSVSALDDPSKQRIIDIPDEKMTGLYKAYGQAVVDYNYAVAYGRRDDIHLKGSQRGIIHAQGSAAIGDIFREQGIQTEANTQVNDTLRNFFGLCTFFYLEKKAEMPLPSQLAVKGSQLPSR
jgi:hypothetical protein